MVKTWIVMLCIILTGLLFGSAERAIDKIQEARIAETAREMVVSDDWLVPHYNGELRLQKPPLTYWLVALSYKIFGVSEFSARLPSMLFGLLSACLLFIWAKSAFNLNIAVNIVLVFTTSFLSLRYFRSGEADATLIFFVSLASFAGFKLFEVNNMVTKNKKLIYLLMLALGLGFLTKGPAAVAIPLLSIFIYAYLSKQLFTLKALISPIGLAIFILTAFAWYAWILLMMPDIAQHFFTHQVDETFITGTHKQPIYFYLAHALEYFAPWSFLLIPAGIWLYQQQSLPKLIHFSLIWLGVVFVLLTLTVNKQTQYALLFLPPIAIIVGYYLEVASAKFYQFNRIIFWLLCVVVLAMVVIGLRKQGIASVLAMPNALVWFMLLILPLLLKKLFQITTPKTPVLMAAALATFAYLFAEQFISKDAEKDDIKTLMQVASIKPMLYQAMPGDGAVSFYAQRPIKPLDEKQIQQLLNTNTALWLMSKYKPQLPSNEMIIEKQVGHWTLWKLTPQP